MTTLDEVRQRASGNTSYPDTYALVSQDRRFLLQQLDALQAEWDALKKQLPDEMQHCTIRFVECAVGHGSLTADNWIKHPCAICELDALKSALQLAKPAIEAGILLLENDAEFWQKKGYRDNLHECEEHAQQLRALAEIVK